MNNTKFRAWDNYNSKMIELGGLEDICCNPYLDFANYEVFQYTGLKDKNGVDICEGDIVKGLKIDLVHPQDAHKVKEEHVTSSVYWDSNSAQFDTDFNFFEFWQSNDDIEVIGNVKQNPELLK